jgi:peptidoglycan hydrolase CwlO-like protein
MSYETMTNEQLRNLCENLVAEMSLLEDSVRKEYERIKKIDHEIAILENKIARLQRFKDERILKMPDN